MVQDGLRRTGYDEVALTSLSTADFSGIDGLVADLVNEQEGCGQRGPVAAVAARRRLHRRHRERDPEGPPHRAHVRARGRHVADPPGDQQAHHRGRPLRRGRRRVLAGLAAGEALLPRRRADRDGRRHARDRRAGARTSSPSVASTRRRRAARRRSAASCRRRTRRSSGSARTASTSCERKVGLLRDAVRKSGVQLRWHDPAATFAEGIASRGDRRIGRVIERVWRAGGHVPGVERALRARPLARRDGRRGSRRRLVRHPAPHRGRGPAVGPHRGRAAPRLPLAGLAGRARTSTGSPTAGGRRATTAGCAPTTRSSTSSPRRCRRRAGARAPARTSSRGGDTPVEFLGVREKASSSAR